ncbi:hypothetical protein K456DRAFT_1939433 [Colletotrichum gloeosporioides 23]|nr:hypothetical protein K456DRAFT_1939433 [Colletotrichum gloeosporioides 23]
MSSFFLEHRYHPEPIKVKEADPASPEGTHEGQARKLQRYEELANRKRQPTERLEVGNKV